MTSYVRESTRFYINDLGRAFLNFRYGLCPVRQPPLNISNARVSVAIKSLHGCAPDPTSDRSGRKVYATFRRHDNRRRAPFGFRTDFFGNGFSQNAAHTDDCDTTTRPSTVNRLVVFVRSKWSINIVFHSYSDLLRKRFLRSVRLQSPVLGGFHRSVNETI